jgi:hypothetical protein
MKDLLVNSRNSPYFKAIHGLVMGFFISYLFFTANTFYYQEGKDTQQFLADFIQTGFLWLQFFMWAIGIQYSKNSTTIRKMLLPALLFGVSNILLYLLNVIIFKSYDNVVTILWSFFAGMLLVLITNLKVLDWFQNKLIPLFVSFFVVEYLNKFYRFNFTRFREILESTYYSFNELTVWNGYIIPPINQPGTYLIQLVFCMIVLTLMKISFIVKRQPESDENRIKAIIRDKIKSPEVIRLELLHELVLAFPNMLKKRIARIFTTIAQPDDINDTKVLNAAIAFLLALSCFQTYAIIEASNILTGWGIVFIGFKLLLIYYLFNDTPYVYVVVIWLCIISIGVLLSGIFTRIQYYDYAMRNLGQQLEILPLKLIVILVGNVIVLFMAWKAYRYRYPNFRLFSLREDNDGNYLL